MFLQKLWGKSPGCISQNLVNIAAVPQGFVTFLLRHDRKTFVLMSQLITAHCPGHRKRKSSSKHGHYKKHFMIATLCDSVCLLSVSILPPTMR